jgi:hypothetical protein
MSELPVRIIGGGKSGPRLNSALTARGVDALARPARDVSDRVRATAAIGVREA